MYISELFYSVQGEGILTGVPSVFIRTSGCNLRCTWCDTPYTSWKPEGSEVPADQIIDYVRRNSRGYVVVTGGEPMIAPATGELTRALREEGQHITIETAGTVWAEVECDLMSISPKLSNSVPRERDGGRWAELQERLRYQPPVLRKLISEFDYQLKFVVAGEEDMEEIHRIVRDLNARPDKVLLMPEGTDPAVLAKRGPWIAELCKQTGFRFTQRLHVALYGNRRGT